jgi:CDP-diacylglycerol--serine O-phosphatidyltransferase
MPTSSHPPPPEAEIPKVKIYFLPNLLTAGNLACGFVALTKIVEADISDGDFTKIKVALMYIGLAFLFDLFDGRVARMGGRESPFGREFDSLADLISFGVAPAFLIHRIVLKDVFVARPEIGWFIASIYVICGAFRLARFNCIAAMSGGGGGKEFLGFPIPSAAGLVGSIAYFLIRWEERDFPQKWWRYTLPVLMLFLSWMMVSEVKYPTFKSLDLKSRRTTTKTLLAILFIGGVVILQEKLLTLFLPLFFTCYLIYGFIRPRISHRVREEIEEEEEEDDHLLV